MSDRFPAEIQIGGKMPKSKLAFFVYAINDECGSFLGAQMIDTDGTNLEELENVCKNLDCESFGR